MVASAMNGATGRALACVVILVSLALVTCGVLLPSRLTPLVSGVTWFQAATVTPGGWGIRQFDGQQGVSTALPDPWRLSGRDGSWTYHINLPDQAEKSTEGDASSDLTYGLWIPRASSLVAIWVDEQLITGVGAVTMTSTDRPWLVSIPRGRGVQHQRTVHIVVKGWGERASGVSSIVYGPMFLLDPMHALRGAILSGGGLSVFAATLMMGFGAGWIAFHLRSCTVVLFACATLLMSVREALVFWGAGVISAQFREAMTYASAGAAFLVSGFLLLHYIEHRDPIWQRSSNGLLLLVLPSLAASGLHLPSGRELMWLWYGLSHVAGLWVTSIVAKEVLRTPSPKRVLILASAVGVMACTFLDDWHGFLSNSPSSYEFHRLAPVASVCALLSVVVSTYLRVFRALVVEGRFKVDLLVEVDRQRLELERLHAAMQEKTKAEVAARERSRIARDLHDGLGAQLVHILSDVEAGELTKGHLVTELKELLDQLRLTMDALDPVATDVVDLLAQIRYRFNDRWRRAGILLTWSVEPLTSSKRFTPEQLTSLQRVMYEIFANIAKHASASHVNIRTFTDPVNNACGIVIKDDGIGFSPSRHQPGRGMGNIADRANELGVSIQVETQIGQGVEVTLSWSVYTP